MAVLFRKAVRSDLPDIIKLLADDQIGVAREKFTAPLTTNKKRKRALEFYQRLGFVASHEGLKLRIS